MKTYCFCIMLIGKGNNKEEAWQDALEAKRIEELDVQDVETEWVEDALGNDITGVDGRIQELEEKKFEFILNESFIQEDKSPSWYEVAEAEHEAERKWDETDDGKELKSLLGQ